MFYRRTGSQSAGFAFEVLDSDLNLLLPFGQAILKSLNLFVRRTAEFSEYRLYRYSLRIVWDPSLPLAAFIGLNPSTADEWQDDPTVRRCRNFAEVWNCGGLLMLNIFAFRATDPAVMKKANEPIGPRNTAAYLIEQLAPCAGPHIAAWGKHGIHRDRGEYVKGQVPRLDCLAVNLDGSPKHPLYLKGDLKPIPFNY